MMNYLLSHGHILAQLGGGRAFLKGQVFDRFENNKSNLKGYLK